MSTCIRTRKELIAWVGCDPDDPELDEWTKFRVPRTRRSVYIPEPWSAEWDRAVHSVAVSRRSSDSGGPMTREGREDVCRVGDVWFVLFDDDGDYTVKMVGEFSDFDLGLEAAAQVATSFVVVAPGRAVSLWLDADLEGVDDDIDDESWTHADEDDDEEDEENDDALAAWRRLIGVTIVDDHGLVLAGPGAEQALPSGSRWVVLPATEPLIDAVNRRAGDAIMATLRLDGTEQRVVVTDAIGRIVAMRLCHALGQATVYELDNDAVRSLDCSSRVISATALRDRP